MKKLKVCIIDDNARQITTLQQYVQLLACIEFVKTLLLPVRLRSGRTVTRQDRIQETVDYLNTNWTSYDLFLLDWSLLGEKDISDPISIAALETLFNTYSSLHNDVKELKRFVVIISGKGSTNKINSDLTAKGMLKGVLAADKPDSKNKPISKSSCPFEPGKIVVPVPGTTPQNVYCSAHDSDAACHRSDCLKNILQAISNLL